MRQALWQRAGARSTSTVSPPLDVPRADVPGVCRAANAVLEELEESEARVAAAEAAAAEAVLDSQVGHGLVHMWALVSCCAAHLLRGCVLPLCVCTQQASIGCSASGVWHPLCVNSWLIQCSPVCAGRRACSGRV